jgi:hypothetical protein
MKKLNIFATAAMLGAMSMSAQAYQLDAGIGYASIDMDTQGDASGFVLGGEYFLEDVDASGVLGEAGFLAKTSDVHLDYVTATFEPAGGGDDIDLTEFNFGINYFFSDVLSVGLDLESEEIDDADELELSDTVLSVGYYVSDNTRVGASYRTGEWESNAGQADTSGMGLEVKTHVDDTYSLYAEYGVETIEMGVDVDITDLSIGGMYYLSETTGIGAEYATQDDEEGGDESATFTLMGEYFINDTSYVQAAYGSTSYDVADDDESELFISYNMRF